MTLPGQPAWLGLAWLGFDNFPPSSESHRRQFQFWYILICIVEKQIGFFSRIFFLGGPVILLGGLRGPP